MKTMKCLFCLLIFGSLLTTAWAQTRSKSMPSLPTQPKPTVKRSPSTRDVSKGEPAKSTSGGPTKNQYDSTSSPLGTGGSNTGPKGNTQYDSTNTPLGTGSNNAGAARGGNQYDLLTPVHTNTNTGPTSGGNKWEKKTPNHRLKRYPRQTRVTIGAQREGTAASTSQNQYEPAPKNYEVLPKKPNVQTEGGTTPVVITPRPKIIKKPSTFDKKTSDKKEEQKPKKK